MAPVRSMLAQSESKAQFFKVLGLSEDNRNDRIRYSMMKNEAVAGRERMCARPDVLWPALRGTAVQPPFSNSQIDEKAISEEIVQIYQHSHPETKKLYDRGLENNETLEANWVIRWLLWHAFRYRDRRNHHRRPSSPKLSSRATRDYWDPVRGKWTSMQTLQSPIGVCRVRAKG